MRNVRKYGRFTYLPAPEHPAPYRIAVDEAPPPAACVLRSRDDGRYLLVDFCCCGGAIYEHVRCINGASRFTYEAAWRRAGAHHQVHNGDCWHGGGEDPAPGGYEIVTVAHWANYQTPQRR